MGKMPHEAAAHETAPHWYALEAAEVLRRFGSTPAGLGSDEAARRLADHGPNSLPTDRDDRWWWRLLRQFHNVLLYVMLGAALVTAYLEHWVDTVVLLGAVVINAVLGFVQEGRTEAALGSTRAAPHARVLRDGHRIDVPASGLVPGDLVQLAAGDHVPADLRLVDASDLRIDEATHTGEPTPVHKTVTAVPTAAAPADRHCVAYAGTGVESGVGAGVVTATGSATESGRSKALLRQVRRTSIPLTRQLNRVGRWLAAVILGLAAVAFVLGVTWGGQSPSDMFTLVVALAAAAIPEGLPAALTVTLSLGVQRLARRNALIRRLPAVDTLGSVTVVCADETGIVTRNEPTVQQVETAQGTISVGGVGYAPVGVPTESSGGAVDSAADPALRLTVRAAILCNDARWYEHDTTWQIDGDPTDAALLVLGAKAGLSQAAADRRWPRVDIVPFASERPFMATLHETESAGAQRIYLEGAPERVLAACTHQLDDAGPVPVDTEHWRRRVAETAAQGLRVLAIAYRDRPARGEALELADVEDGFVLLSLVGMIDPPRPEAIAAVRDCHRAGITVTMITGDHPATAAEIGNQIGLGRGREILTGADIDAMDQETLRQVAGETEIFAQSGPEHKLAVVRALQRNGEVVAVTGKGVADAPALARADIGVALGRRGSETAAADMVLADDTLATIAAAVREGRGVYDNLKKFILFMLPTNGGEVLVVLAAVLFSITLPLTPAQLLWINLATVSTLGLALALEPADPDVMRRPPRSPGESLLSGFFVWRVGFVSVLMMTGALTLFLWELASGTAVETARTVAVNAIVITEMFYLVNSRRIHGSVLDRDGLFGSRYVLVAIGVCALLQLVYTYTPFMQSLFGSAGLNGVEWVKVLAVGLTIFLLAEAEKTVVRRLRDRRQWAARWQRMPALSVQPPTHILVATDLSDAAGLALQRAAALASEYRARLTVVHVLGRRAERTATETATQRLREHIEQYARGSDEHTVVRAGDINSAIVAEVADRAADLLVIGAHGAGRTVGRTIGSTAELLARNDH